MILVDTGVIIDYSRGNDTKLVNLLRRLPVAICGVVRAELLCGVRNPKQKATLLTLLAAFRHIPMAEPLWG